ncbi:MAG: hypothetical protein NXY59_00445 [Aigarchaeota archaeon]|nr:hypothetical protein [Candidatus Pelearchaeum maunauluense]
MRSSRRRIKLEMVNEEGERLTLIFEGRMSREKLLQLADFMELYGGESGARQRPSNKLSRLIAVIEKHFPFTGFTTRDVMEAYRLEYREPITLSTASTYLSRLADRGYLERIAVGNIAKYRLVSSVERRGGIDLEEIGS